MNAEIEQKEYETDELSERLENAERDQKELFLILFQVCLSSSSNILNWAIAKIWLVGLSLKTSYFNCLFLKLLKFS